MKLTYLIWFLTALLFYTSISFCQTRKIDSLLLVLKNGKEDSTKVNTLNDLVIEFRYTNPDTAIYFANEALPLASKLKYEMGIADSKLRIGMLCADMGKYNEGVKSCNEALIIYNKLILPETKSGREKILTKIGRTYNVIGHNRISQGNYPEGLKNSFLALKIREELGDKKGIALTESNIGNIYFYLSNYTESLKHFSVTLKISLELGDKEVLSGTYMSIGNIYSVQGNYPEALKNYSTALKLAEEVKDTHTIGKIYSNLGDINERRENYSEALKYYFAALKIFKEIGVNEDIALMNISIGSVYTKQKKYKDASEYANKGLAVSKEVGSSEYIKLSYENLARLDSAQSNFKQALEHYKLYITSRDSLVNSENTKKMVQQQMQYEFDKKEDSLKQLHTITQTKLDSQKKQKNFYLAGAGMLALLSLFVYLNFRNQKKINRLAGDAHAKEKAELELQSLRAQLNPHFMFNSLNAIQELILLEENEKSQSYLARFAKLLRMLLENAERPFIPLQREIDFLQLYLSLENLRIPDLQFSINVDHNINTEATQIPNMILQPYIENAIWHGLSHKQSDRRLQIRAIKSNGIVKYEIEDNGVGRKKSAELKGLYRKEHKSKGMELLSKRFKLLAKEYGSDIETTVGDVMSKGEVAGTLVTIKVPMEITTKK